MSLLADHVIDYLLADANRRYCPMKIVTRLFWEMELMGKKSKDVGHLRSLTMPRGSMVLEYLPTLTPKVI